MKQANSSGTIHYLWSSVLGEPVAELTSGGVYRAYVYGPGGGQLIAMQSYDGGFYWLHTDHLGSGRKITNTSGTVVYRGEFDPHGQALYEWHSSGQTYLNSHKYTGYERDWATNLNYAKARTYHHNRGRFMQPDPLGLGAADLSDPQSLNRYSYVGNDPANFVDPTGLTCVEVAFTCVTIFGQRTCGYEIYWNDSCDNSRSGSGGGGGNGGGGSDGRGGGGVSRAEPQKRTDRKPEDPCPAEKRRFFDWLDGPLGQMAKDINTTKALMLTLAAKEGGWTTGNLDHNQPLNNPFGVNRINSKGQAAGNVNYPSLNAAIEYWNQRFGDRVRGAQSVDAFLNGLQRPAQGQPYNSADPKYESKFRAVYNTMLRFMSTCGIQQ